VKRDLYGINVHIPDFGEIIKKEIATKKNGKKLGGLGELIKS
jgi:hypothetical protein